MSAAYRHCVNGLLTSIVWTLTGRLDDVCITDIVYLLDVLVVIVYMSYWNCWDYLLLHEDWGECSEDWAGACMWGGGGVKFLTEKKISAKKCSWGLKTFGHFEKRIFFIVWTLLERVTRSNIFSHIQIYQIKSRNLICQTWPRNFVLGLSWDLD